ncbi:MAG: type II toxin-antitoxin system RelB/DinJ family antitoxin [Muricoprocola sp.]
MAAKTANVNVRVEQSIKEQAEAILDKLGISASAFINMTYRQVIMHKGIPFEVSLPKDIQTRDTMTDAEFDAMMSKGLAQAKTGDSIPYEDVFDSLLKGL